MNIAINIPDNIFFGINETEHSLTQILKEKLALELYKSHQILSEEGELEGILFTSDIDKDKKIYYMDIDLVIKVFRIVGNDYPTYVEMGLNPDTNKEQVKVK